MHADGIHGGLPDACTLVTSSRSSHLNIIPEGQNDTGLRSHYVSSEYSECTMLDLLPVGLSSDQPCILSHFLLAERSPVRLPCRRRRGLWVFVAPHAAYDMTTLLPARIVLGPGVPKSLSLVREEVPGRPSSSLGLLLNYLSPRVTKRVSWLSQLDRAEHIPTEHTDSLAGPLDHPFLFRTQPYRKGRRDTGGYLSSIASAPVHSPH